MAQISKKEIKRRRRKKIAELKDRGIILDYAYYSLQSGPGKNPKRSKYHGGVTNQRGAFGKPGWMRGLTTKIHETFSMTNHERCLENRKRRVK